MSNEQKGVPEVIWFSDPVNAGETVMVSGSNFTEKTKVDVALISPPENKLPSKSEPPGNWTQAEILQVSSDTINFVLPPDLPPGIYAVRIKNGKLASDVFYLNQANTWWHQGDAGESASQGGWLRTFGKCLGLKSDAKITLNDGNNSIELKTKQCSRWELGGEIPRKTPPGLYTIYIYNGHSWAEAGKIEVKAGKAKVENIFPVTDFGAKPNEDADATGPILYAISQALAAGGGVVYFPRGRYRVDCPKRVNYPIMEPVKIPPGITLRGESMELVSLFWPERKEPLPALLQGSNDFAIEDLSIYTQGKHSNIITGTSNVRISRVRIRANSCYRLKKPETEYIPKDYMETQFLGEAISLRGNNISITNCDIYHSGSALHLEFCNYGVISGNILEHNRNYLMAQSCSNIIFEDNVCRGNNLFANGSSWAIGNGKWVEHFYYARNRTAHHYGGDRENMTTDNHGTAYLGKIVSAEGCKITLADSPDWGTAHKDNIPDWNKTAVYILSGRGAGQYRRIVDCDGKKLKIDSPWQVAPDKSSLLTIGVYCGKGLVIGNEVEDAGSVVQLYCFTTDWIVAENISRRAGNINAGGSLLQCPDHVRVEPCWYCQYLDNITEEGNGWGDGGKPCTATVNGALGGTSYLNLYGAVNTDIKNTAITRWQVVRNQHQQNNSGIRISSDISDVLVENCNIEYTESGILFEPGFNPGDHDSEFVVQSHFPRNVVLRQNQFNNVSNPYDISIQKNESLKIIKP